MEDVPVSVEAFHFVQNDGLRAVGALFAVLIHLLREAFEVLAVKVHVGLGDGFFLVQWMVHGDELLVVGDHFELFFLQN